MVSSGRAHAVRALAERDVERLRRPGALDLDRDLVAGLARLDRRADVLGRENLLAADVHDDVAVAQAAGVRRAAGDDAGDLRAARADARLRRHAEIRAADRAAALQARDDLADGVRRDGEADADVAAAAGGGRDLRVHADDAAGAVEQRAAGVAGVDRRVGLDDL